MMIKKQLSVLAGSLLLVAGANAAITAGDTNGTSSSAILVLGSSAGSYVFDTGLTADQLAAGNGFSIDISAAIGDLGTIDTFAVFGTLGGAGQAYSYTSYTYASAGMGVVYAQSSAGALQTDALLDGAVNNISNYINNVVGGGFFADGTGGDLTGTPLGSSLFSVGLENLGASLAAMFVQTQDANGVASQQEVTILAPAGTQEGAYIEGLTGNVTTAVPVPAAAWLFGSALLGLGVVRRKS